TNGISPPEDVARERLVHDQDSSSQALVLEWRKVATGDDRRAERAQVTARDVGHRAGAQSIRGSGQRVDAESGLELVLNGHPIRKRNLRNARLRAQAALQFIEAVPDARRVCGRIRAKVFTID